MINVQARFRKKLPARDYQEECQRPAIDAAPIAVVHAQRRDLDIPLDMIGELRSSSWISAAIMGEGQGRRLPRH